MGLKFTEKKSRILCEDDVIKAVDKHTNEDGTLDNDISCILEEVHSVSIVGSKGAMENIRVESTEIERLKSAKTIRERADLAIEELYNIAENTNKMDKETTKRCLLYVAAILEGTFSRI